MQDNSKHIVELQSLRGIAAVTVMIHHCLRTLGSSGWAWTLSEVPLNARAAVVIFFVLSGYVLSLSLRRRGLNREGLLVFYVRRVFRVYPALWVATILGMAYLWLLRPIYSPNLAYWAQHHYDPTAFGAWSVVSSFLGLRNYLLPPSWTITVELMASIILPFVVFVMTRNVFIGFCVILATLMVGIVLGPAARQVPFYMGSFVLGASVAVLPHVRELRPNRWMTSIAAVILIFSQLAISANSTWLAMIIESICSAVVISGIVAHRVRWMQAKPLVLLGDWSYSIYLLHLPIAYAIARILDGHGYVRGDLGVWGVIVALITAVLVIPLAAVVYRKVEIPGIMMGNRILGRLVAR